MHTSRATVVILQHSWKTTQQALDNSSNNRSPSEMQSPCIQQQQQQTAKHSKILADLEGCQQPCSGASCRCSTVPRQLQYIADALSCFESAQDSEPASPLAQLHLRAKQLLQLCDALVQHNHSQAALVAATEAFYR